MRVDLSIKTGLEFGTRDCLEFLIVSILAKLSVLLVAAQSSWGD